ncbi:hypothetical protein Bbelb_345620 [Branchiostoma belcheri]|nr:hypothetical protein Bbelb_438320 [Branchiostoma belcheri]KAI8487569.1 hypothetical protein Bbelb_345620 [Branchiostoma belcheri]
MDDSGKFRNPQEVTLVITFNDEALRQARYAGQTLWRQSLSQADACMCSTVQVGSPTEPRRCVGRSLTGETLWQVTGHQTTQCRPPRPRRLGREGHVSLRLHQAQNTTGNPLAKELSVDCSEQSLPEG